MSGDPIDPRNYDTLIGCLEKDIGEEVGWLRKVVADEDSSCPARPLRAERLRAYEHVLELLEVYKTWEW